MAKPRAQRRISQKYVVRPRFVLFLAGIGIIELLEVTENQFSRIDYLVGERQTLVEESTDRLIEV